MKEKNTELSQRDRPELDLPLPEEHFRSLGIGSRTTFFRWEANGLRVIRVGKRRFIKPSDLNRFMESMNQKATSISDGEEDNND